MEAEVTTPTFADRFQELYPPPPWDFSVEALTELRTAWSNEWAPSGAFLGAMFKAAWETGCSAVLECGSGLSTTILAKIAAQTDIQVASLEHDSIYYQITSRQLASLGLRDQVKLFNIPLHDYDGYQWYGINWESSSLKSLLPADIDLLIVDGPPGTTPGGRYGALPQIWDRLAPSCKVILDDADRPGERRVLGRWQSEGLVKDVQVLDGYAVCSVKKD